MKKEGTLDFMLIIGGVLINKLLCGQDERLREGAALNTTKRAQGNVLDGCSQSDSFSVMAK